MEYIVALKEHYFYEKIIRFKNKTIYKINTQTNYKSINLHTTHPFGDSLLHHKYKGPRHAESVTPHMARVV